LENMEDCKKVLDDLWKEALESHQEHAISVYKSRSFFLLFSTFLVFCEARTHNVFSVVDVIVVMIPIRGSVPLTYGSGSYSFRRWLSRCQQKISFLKVFFCLIRYCLKVHLHQSSKIESCK
jgi:hypothetical protein